MKPTAAIRSFLALAGSSMLAISHTHAGILYWDGATPAGAPGGGAGTWNLALTNWDNTPSADSSTAWVNANLDTAVFGGTAGTVTLGSNISVGGLRFDTTGYNITTGANTLSFDATNNTILFNNATTPGTGSAATTATITGAVGGTGNVILSHAADRYALGTLTLNGTSTGGWSGSTTINSGMTLALAGSNQALLNTSGITLNGGYMTTNNVATQTGGILLTNTNATEAALNRVSNSAAIISNGGFITVTNSGATTYSEDMGALDLRRGQLNVTQTNSSGTQTLTFAANSLTNVNGSARTNAITSAINFSGASLGTTGNSIKITSQATTGSGEIIAPWATFGNTAGAQNDYAVYNRAGSAGTTNALGIQGAAIAASTQSTWSTAYSATSNHTLTNAAGTATQLTATRSINTLRNTGGTAQNITSITSNVITVTGSSYANGDVVTTGMTIPTGLTRETVYYVVNAGIGGAGTFQLAATPGGAAITGLTHVASSPLVGGIMLSSGNNLETYGILNGSSTYLGIGASGAGAVTTPTGGGNLYLTTGAGPMVINAPITDNGGAVTLVRNGGVGRLILSGNNTFTGGLVVNGGSTQNSVTLQGTQSFTGGIILNGGGIGEQNVNNQPTTNPSALNGNAITVNGPSHLLLNGGTLGTTSTVTINAAGALTIGANGTLDVQGVVSGSGLLDAGGMNVNATSTVTLSNSANTFTGNVIYTNNNAGPETLNVNSIGDAGKVTFGVGGGAIQVFALNSTATSGLTFNTRQFEIAGNSAVGRIGNNSNQAFTINTDLLTTGTGARTLQLQGTGAGLSTFAGKLENGSLTSLAITKAEAGIWSLTNTNNTYTGGTTVSAGTLRFANNALGTTGAINASGGTLQWAAGNTQDLSNRLATTAAAITTLDTNGNNVTFANALGTANTGLLVKTGSGTLTLQATNNYTGTTTVNAGTLALDYTSVASKLADGAALILGGGTVDLKNGASSHTEIVSATTLTAGTASYVTRTSGTSVLQLGAITNNSGTLDIGTNGIATTTNTHTAGTILGTWLTVGGADWGISGTTGTNPITAYTGYTDVTRLAPGVIPNTSTANVRITEGTGSAGNITLAAATTTINTLNQSISGGTSAATVTLAGQTLHTNGILMGPTSGALTIGTSAGSGTLKSTAATGSVIVTNNSANTLTINSVIANTTTTSLLKNGTGTLVLSAANTYTGGTTIQDGTIKAGATQTGANSIFGTAALSIANKSTAGLDLNGFDVNVKSLSGGGSLGGNVSLGSNTLFLTNTGNETYSGVISGTGNLKIDSSSGITLAGANTYSGITTLGTGNVTLHVNTLANGGVASSIGQSTNAADRLVFNGTTTGSPFDYAPTLQYTSTAAASTDRQFTISGSGTNVGGALAVGGTGAVTWSSTAAVTYSGTGTRLLGFAGDGSGLGTFAGRIRNNGSDATSIYKRGNSTWSLTNTTSDFTGSIIFSANGNGRLNYASAGGANPIIFNQTTGTAILSYTGPGQTMSGAITASALTSGTITLDSSGTGAINYSNNGNLGTGAATGNKGLVLSGTNTGTNILNGLWANNTAGGAATLTKNGTGTWAITSNNTFSGALSITGGTLMLGNSTANGGIQNAASIAISSGATLAINRSSAASQLPSGTAALGNVPITGAGSVLMMGGGGSGSVTMALANTYTGGTTLQAGTLNINSVGVAGVSGPLGNGGTFTINGGSLDAATSDRVVANVNPIAVGGNFGFVGTNALTLPGTVNLGGATRTITTTANTLTLTGIMSNGGLTKAGAGTLALNGNNTYTGATAVNVGKLIINGNQTSANGAVTVASNATLGGSGMIGGAVTVDSGGFHAAGNSIGTQTMLAGYTQNGTEQVELGTPGATPAAGVSDRTSVTGNLSLGSGSTLQLIDNAGANAQGSMGAGAYRLITFSGTRTGTFTNIANPLNATLHEKVVYNGTSNGSVDLEVYRLASANTISTPVNLGNVRVGGTFGTSALSIQNTASNDGFSEGLNATIGSTTGSASVSGINITNLAGQATDNTSISVGLGGNANTGTAGLKTGTVAIGLASNGTNSGYANTALTGQTVTVNGAVYNAATANTIASVDVGKTRVGGSFTGTQSLTISNTAASGIYTEGLNATVGSTTGGASGSGSVSNLAGGSSSTSITAGLGGANTSTSGIKTGSVSINLASSGINSGLSDLGLGSQTVGVSGTVYDYADAAFSHAGGDGSLSGGGASYTLDFGTGLLLNTTYTATIQLANTLLSGFQDDLGGSYASIASSEFNSGVEGTTIASLVAGSNNTFTITFYTGSMGTFNDTLTFSGLSKQSGLSDAGLGNFNIALTATAVPEPRAALLGGIGVLLLLRRRRR